jgi:hypothetical protein
MSLYRKVESNSFSSLPYPYFARRSSCCVAHERGMHRKVQNSPVDWRHLYVSAVVRAGKVSLHAMGPPRVVSRFVMAYLRRT